MVIKVHWFDFEVEYCLDQTRWNIINFGKWILTYKLEEVTSSQAAYN